MQTARLCAFLLALSLFSVKKVSAIDQKENYLLILRQFYNQTGGNNWKNSTGWKNGTDYCDNWFSLTCNSDGFPSEIHLDDNNLVGNISLTFWDLISVRNLTLSKNKLSGSVPEEISQLDLVHLDLSHNLFNGNLPDSLSRMTNLEYLNVGSNVFNSSVPSLQSLQKLEVFLGDDNLFTEFPEFNERSIQTIDLTNNFISSNIPDSIGNLLNLKRLYISINLFHGNIPKSIGNLVNLEEFLANLNFLDGSIPDEIGGLSSLKSISLSTNNLEGRIPGSVGNLKNLVVLDLAENQLNYTIPQTFGECEKLEKIVLASNLLSGNLSSSLSNLKHLRYLDIGNNVLTGSVPFSPNWVNLTAFLASGNRFVGIIPKQLDLWYTKMQFFDVVSNSFSGNLPDLPPTIINFYFKLNKFNGSIPDSYKNLVNLQDFFVSDNQLTGRIPDIFGNLSKLVNVDCNNNMLSGELPPLDSIPNISIFWAGNNMLNGSIPTSLSKHPYLLSLDLSNNNFTGGIPGFVSSSMRTLNLSGNRLNGTLENLKNTQVSSLNVSRNLLSGEIFSNKTAYVNINQRLSVLDLSHNQFSGPFFASEGVNFPPSIRYVDISHNQFSGTLTTFPSPTDQLETLLMSNNMLEGYALGKLFTFANLQTLDISNNRLRGSIPRTFAQMQMMQYLNLENNRLSGEFDLPNSLISLNLRGNGLVSNNFQFLDGSTQLEMIDISLNHFSDALPVVLGDMKNLRYFDASNNSISGEIPVEVCELRSLQTFNVRGNLIKGSVCNFLSDLTYLDVSNNSFNGTTAFLSNLASLKYLDICNNNFSGPFNSFNPFIKLQFLDANHNNLSGSLPDFKGLPELKEVDLSFNRFSGKIPSVEGCQSLTILNLNNNNFTEASDFSLPANSTACDFTVNGLICPVSLESITRCGASCVLGDNATQYEKIRINFSFSSFNWTQFRDQLATHQKITNIRLTLLQMNTTNSKRASSGFADISISPPFVHSTNEGSAIRVIQMLQKQSSFDLKDYRISSIQYPIPSDGPSSSSSEEKPKETISIGIIVGLIVGLVLLAIIILALIAFLYIRKKRPRFELHQLSDLDLTKINLGAAKKSVINYMDLKKMVQIGSGGFGVVYRADWRELKVAVKQIRAEHVNEHQLTSFLREVAILQNLRSHPNVVLFIGLTIPPQPLSLITEFCEGGSLEHYLKYNPSVSDGKIMKFVTGIALGMLHLHLEKVVHRDLAVRNILLTKFLEPKVTDFGLSRMKEEEEGPATTVSNVGPLKWMAPESILNREYSFKSDVFSFGVVIWEILNRKEPYENIPPLEAAISVARDGLRLKISKQNPEILQMLMEGCWKQNPEDRPDFYTICEMLGANKSDSTTYRSFDISRGGGESSSPYTSAYEELNLEPDPPQMEPSDSLLKSQSFTESEVKQEI